MKITRRRLLALFYGLAGSLPFLTRLKANPAALPFPVTFGGADKLGLLVNTLYGESGAPRAHEQMRTGFGTQRAALAIVNHCRNTQEALALVIVPVGSYAIAGCIWTQIERLLDDSIYGGARTKRDAQHNLYRYVINSAGGWSKVMLISGANKERLHERVAGLEPTLMAFEESVYDAGATAQLGRRPGCVYPIKFS